MRSTVGPGGLLVVAGLVLAGLAAGLWMLVAFEDRLKPEIVIVENATGSTISVGVVGGVEQPGVYTLAEDARLADLIDAAGGPVEDADMPSLNLATRLQEGDLVSIPVVAAEVPDESPAGDVASPAMGLAAEDPRLDLNSATLEELDGLPGIGPVIAQAILDARAERGGFTSVDELEAVPGISSRMVEELRQLVMVSA